MDGILQSTSAREVLSYWYGEDHDAARPQIWFEGRPETDQEISERFSKAVAAATEGRLDDWSRHPRSRLALILLLDQFTRHVHRGTPQAFAGDHAAQRQVAKAVAKGEDALLRPFERAFLYMPLQHAEDLQLQERGVACYERLFHEVPRSQQVIFGGFLESARDHAAIIRRFGRFPDRNHLLGRETTPEEAHFLETEPRGWFERQA